MSNPTRVAQSGISPEISRPDPARLLAGDPVHSSWTIEERGNIFCGMWQSTPGKWRVSYTEWEDFHILSGHSILTDSDGTVTNLKAGDSYVLRPGLSGTWEVVETTLKDYVVIT